MTKLILFPYAGSLGIGYNQWMKQLRTKFEVHRITYTELKEGIRNYNCTSWEELISLTYEKILPIMKEGDYIFFGHSMGGRVEYEMYKKAVENNLPLPKQMIVSGCRVLSVPVKDPRLQTEQEFRDEYIELGGLSDEVLACKELADLAFEDLKKDAILLSEFRFSPIKVDVPVVILNGSKDKRSTKEEWEELFRCPVDWKLYEGKHFFIYDHQDEILEQLMALA